MFTTSWGGLIFYFRPAHQGGPSWQKTLKQYDPKGTEDPIYQEWCDKGYFHTQIDRSKKPFTIVMPPPNITGQLHMGHALDETMQDILIRYKRMQGYAALWLPGTDHASIATEVKMVNQNGRGPDKRNDGPRGFLERAWEWKEHVWRPHCRPAEKAGLLLRLGAGAVHHG